MKPIPFLFCLSVLLFLFLQANARKPNFVYVMVDDAGYGDFPASDKKVQDPERGPHGQGGHEVDRLLFVQHGVARPPGAA